MDKCKELSEDICVLETAEEVVGTENSGLKRKVVNSSYSDAEFRYSTSVVKRRIFRRVVVGESEKKKNTTKSMKTSGLNFDPCCSYSSSHNGSGSTHIDKEAPHFSDLEEEQREIFGDKSISSTYGLDSCRERRESMAPLALSDHVIADLKVTGELLQPSMLNTEEIENIFSVNPSRRSKRAKMPSNAELDDFFSVTENDLMQQFSHKYNFDFVKEEPFEGQYEWVQVKENTDTWNPRHTITTVGYMTREQDYNNEVDTWNPHCNTTTE